MPREGREGWVEAEGEMGRGGVGEGERKESMGQGLFLLYLV